MKRIALLFVLVLVVALVPALADIKAIGSPIPTNSWAQAFEESGVGLFDHMIIQWVSGSQFESPDFTGLAPFGWSVDYYSPTLSQASGPALNSINPFNINFLGDPINPTKFNFWALNGTTVLESASATWAGGWGTPTSTGKLDAPQIPVPEPGSVLLLGTLLLGVGGLLRRKLV